MLVADLHSALAPALLAVAARPPGHPGRLRDERPRRAPAGLLAVGGRPPRCRAARRDGDRRAGVRRRPGGRHRALRAAGGQAGSGTPTWPIVTQGPGNLGTGTRWGFSGVSCRRGGQRRLDPGRPSGRLAADLRRRRPGAAPRHLAPQPDRVRPGRPARGRHRGARLRCRRLGRCRRPGGTGRRRTDPL